MEREILLQSQKNAVFNAIRQHELNPSDFAWQRRPSAHRSEIRVDAISYRPSAKKYYFEFGFSGLGRFAAFRPGWEVAVEVRRDIRSWDEHLRILNSWVSSLRREVEAPDLWATVSQEKALAEAASGVANTPFTTEEQQYISQQLHEIKEYLFRTQDLSEQHREFVTRQLDYLKEAAKRQGRTDWLKMIVGTLLGIVMQTALTSEAARELFRFAGNALSQLLGDTLLLP